MLAAIGFAYLTSPPNDALAGSVGSQLAASCASCHRSDGRGSGIPSLVGLDESHILQSMRAYRADAHRSQIMHVVADALSPEEIAAVAHYLAGQQARNERQ